ncbi:MAG: sigma factor-like helix-turn-helix DNA-binding protein [Oligoflexales bacterium]
MKGLNSICSYLDDESTQRTSDKLSLDTYLSKEQDPREVDLAARTSWNSAMCLHVRKSLSKLTKRQRELIHLRFWHSLNSTEISKLLGISEDEFFKTLNESLAKLRKEIVISIFKSVKPKSGLSS